MRITRRRRALLGILFLLTFQPVAAHCELSSTDRELLLKLEKSSLQYFIRMSDKVTGLTRDSSRPGAPASIAATGFALASVSIGGANGWISEDLARSQIEKTLKTLLRKAEHKNGFFYHFLDPRTGKRVWQSEASSIDTALLVAGALVAAHYYPDTRIDTMAHQLYDRVQWSWMLNGSLLLCMGWTPENGFLPYYWDTYSEHLLIQALALGSSTHAIPERAWQEWLRNEDVYRGKTVIYSHTGSLFTYQFPHAFIDFQKIDDHGVDYFENSVRATLANREYALSLRDRYSGYRENSWGLSASLGPGGYKAYGGKPGEGLQDGTLAPYSAVSSLIFTPEESMAVVRMLFQDYADKIYGTFGFKDAYNLDKKWWAQEYLGIDQGITVLMLENYLNDGAVWKKFMAERAVHRWMDRCKLWKGAANASKD